MSKLPLVSEHAWIRWGQRFPGRSMIAALEAAKPVSNTVKIAHHIRGKKVVVVADRYALFVIARNANTVITVFRKKKISPKKNERLQKLLTLCE